jgi:phosphoglycolate phosphatase-like HAD superfamily hydrolase
MSARSRRSAGSGVWDARTARNLGLPFVGIGSGARAARLAAEGARHVVEDFTDLDRFLGCLDAAEVPRQ